MSYEDSSNWRCASGRYFVLLRSTLLPSEYSCSCLSLMPDCGSPKPPYQKAKILIPRPTIQKKKKFTPPMSKNSKPLCLQTSNRRHHPGQPVVSPPGFFLFFSLLLYYIQKWYSATLNTTPGNSGLPFFFFFGVLFSPFSFYNSPALSFPSIFSFSLQVKKQKLE